MYVFNISEIDRSFYNSHNVTDWAQLSGKPHSVDAYWRAEITANKKTLKGGHTS